MLDRRRAWTVLRIASMSLSARQRAGRSRGRVGRVTAAGTSTRAACAAIAACVSLAAVFAACAPAITGRPPAVSDEGSPGTERGTNESASEGGLAGDGSTAEAERVDEPFSHVETAAPEVVDWSWIRMHQSRAVIGLIEDVQEKKRDAATLDGLADAKTLRAIVATRWTPEALAFETAESRRDSPAPPIASETREADASAEVGEAPRADRSPSRSADRARATGGWKSVELSSRFTRDGISSGATLEPNFRAPRCQPAEIRFPSLYDKQRAVARVRCTARTDGTVAATLEQQTFRLVPPLFRILAIRSFTGRYRHVPIARPAGTPGVLQAGIPYEPVVDDEVVSAPFQMTIEPGQDFEVDVEFQPTWHLVEVGAGPKQAKVLLDGRPKPIGPFFPDGTGALRPTKILPPWHTEVSASGMFNGLYLGSALVIPWEWSPTLLKQDWVYDPRKPQVFEVGVAMIPLQANARVEIVPDSLPDGVTMTPPLLAIQASGTAQANGTLHFAIDREAATSIWRQPDLVAQPMVFRVEDSAGRTSYFELSLTLVRGHYEWSFEGDVGCIDKYYVDLTLLPEDQLIAAFYLASRDHVFRCKARMTAYFDPGPTAWSFLYFVPRNDTVDTQQRTRMTLPVGGYRDAITRRLRLKMSATRLAD
jgi:hypothetical protein